MQPPDDAVRASALELLASGNSLESVAHVLGVPIDTLREWGAQAAGSRPEDARATEPLRAWLSFPGTVVYPTGSNWAIIAAALMAVLVVIPAFGWQLVFNAHPRPGVIVLCAAIALACVVGAVQSIRAARVNCFEMRPNAIARYTLAGCTVVPYADIIGLTAGVATKTGVCMILFYTRTGVSLSIQPSFTQLEDERLWAWLQAIPARDGGRIWRPSDR